MSHHPTILVCDDESHIRHVVGLKLQDAGYRVISASDGEEGLRLARQHQPDLVITDYSMPKVDGFALSQALRSDPRTKAIHLILLTVRSGSLPAETLDCIEFVATFSKPFSPRDLVDEVRNHVAVDMKPLGRHGE